MKIFNGMLFGIGLVGLFKLIVGNNIPALSILGYICLITICLYYFIAERG